MRSVLVTGASSGIGEACAQTLLTSGWRVFAGVRKRADGARLRRELGPALIPLVLDVTRPRSIAAAALTVRRRCGKAGLAGLVNNAGVTFSGPLELVPLAAVRALFEVNVLGVVAITQALLPLLRQAQGRIVNLGSLSGLVAAPFIGPYVASKFALEGLSDSLRMELAPFGIEVSLIQPGPTLSKIWDKAQTASARFKKGTAPGRRALYAKAWDRFDEVLRSAAGGAGPVSGVVEAVVHALSSEAPQTRYPLDGGGRPLLALSDRERDRLLLEGYGLPGRMLTL